MAHDQRSACWFHKSLASSQIEYENHRGTTHKRYAVVRSVPSLCSGMREQSCSIPRGLKVNKNSAEGEVFFVDFPSYRISQAQRDSFRMARDSPAIGWIDVSSAVQRSMGRGRGYQLPDTPRADPYERSLAHTALISDDWRRSDQE